MVQQFKGVLETTLEHSAVLLAAEAP